MILSGKNNQWKNGKLTSFGYVVRIRYYLWILVLLIAILAILLKSWGN